MVQIQGKSQVNATVLVKVVIAPLLYPGISPMLLSQDTMETEAARPRVSVPVVVQKNTTALRIPQAQHRSSVQQAITARRCLEVRVRVIPELTTLFHCRRTAFCVLQAGPPQRSRKLPAVYAILERLQTNTA
jgi:hypothetical protein